MVTKKAATKAPAKRAVKADYPKDNGPLTKKQVKQVAESAPKPKRVKKETAVFDIKPEEPGVHIGHYSVRTVHPSGQVDFVIDWDRLKKHVQESLA